MRICRRQWKRSSGRHSERRASGVSRAACWSPRAVGDGTKPGIEMGPLVTAEHCKKVESYVDKGVAEGATALVDGRTGKRDTGYFLGPTIFDHVTPQMTDR